MSIIEQVNRDSNYINLLILWTKVVLKVMCHLVSGGELDHWQSYLIFFFIHTDYAVLTYLICKYLIFGVRELAFLICSNWLCLLSGYSIVDNKLSKLNLKISVTKSIDTFWIVHGVTMLVFYLNQHRISNLSKFTAGIQTFNSPNQASYSYYYINSRHSTMFASTELVSTTKRTR